MRAHFAANGPSAPRIRSIRQFYDTDIDDLWDACTTPERLARWFAPVAGDFTLGGGYQVEGNAHGTIRRCDAPHRVDLTWEFRGDVSLVTLSLTAENDHRSRLSLTHTADISTDTWAEYGPGAGGVGWDLSLLGLTQHLKGQEDPPEATEWIESDDAKRFMTSSSRAWADRSMAQGTPEPAARAAEARTTAFFLGGE